MTGIGHRFPEFALTGVVSNDTRSAFQSCTHDSFPTEIAAFGKLEKEFRELCPYNWQKGEETLKAA
jgi:alkyl hydroperoxide reductase subunit AhpC